MVGAKTNTKASFLEKGPGEVERKNRGYRGEQLRMTLEEMECTLRKPKFTVEDQDYWDPMHTPIETQNLSYIEQKNFFILRQ